MHDPARGVALESSNPGPSIGLLIPSNLMLKCLVIFAEALQEPALLSHLYVSVLQEEAYTKELAEWDRKIAERTNELVSCLKPEETAICQLSVL